MLIMLGGEQTKLSARIRYMVGALFQPFPFPVQTEEVRKLTPFHSKNFKYMLAVGSLFCCCVCFFPLMLKKYVEKHKGQVSFLSSVMKKQWKIQLYSGCRS